MSAHNITSDQFETLVLKSDRPVLVDFWATWCGPCKMLAPILDKYASNPDTPVAVVKVDIDQAEQIANQFNIKSAPTLVIFEKGIPLATKRGFMSGRQIEKWVAETINIKSAHSGENS